jgi:hypothetical protein
MIDDALAAMAMAGGVAAVQAMTTDAWDAVRTRFAALFRHIDDATAAAMTTRLDEDNDAIARADDRDTLSARLADQWKVRLADLLETHPAVAAELTEVIARATSQPVTSSATITSSARAVLEEAGNNRLGIGQSEAAISDSPDASIRNSGNIG